MADFASSECDCAGCRRATHRRAGASADAADGNFRRRDSPTCNSYFGCIVYSAQAVDILVAFVWRPRIRWAQRRRLGRRRVWGGRGVWGVWRGEFRGGGGGGELGGGRGGGLWRRGFWEMPSPICRRWGGW